MDIRCLLLALALAVAGPALAAETSPPPATTASMFEQRFPLTSGVLAADFPQDLQALGQSFAEIDRTEISPPIKMERAFLSLTALRKKYAPQMRFARTDMSALVVISLAGFYQSVLRREGTKVCGGFAVDGAGTLFTLGHAADYALELDRQGAAYFAAVASALENPDVVGPATDADWEEVMGGMVAAGHPPSYVVSIAAGKPSDPDLCPALTALLRAMVEVRSDAGKRARADFIQNVAGY